MAFRDIKRRRGAKDIENVFEEVMTKNLPILVRENVTQVQEAWRIPKGPTLRHIIIKISKFKDKERILKAIKEKQLVT